MDLSVNGHSKVPPGFRFHPTEEELLLYYLKKKVASEKIDLDVIRDIDLNKLEPWDIQEKCRIGSGPQNDWYFFSHKDKKYPTGTRTNRATAAGFWKATGRDKMIYSNFKRIGMRKTLVFYKGRAPHGEKSDWIMHEYRLEDCTSTTTIVHDHQSVSRQDNCVSEDGWVICRVFRKKNYQKAVDNNGTKSIPTTTTNSLSSDEPHKHHQLLNSSSKKVLDHLFSCMEKTMTYHHHHHHDHEMINHHQPTNLIPTYTSFCTDNSPETPQGSLIINDSNNVLNTHYTSTNHQDHDHDHDHQYMSNLPMLTSGSPTPYDPMINACYDDHQRLMDDNDYDDGDNNGSKSRLSDWMTLDRLIASQLDGQDQDLCFRAEL